MNNEERSTYCPWMGSTRAEIQNALIARFGEEGVHRLIARGGLQIVEWRDELPDRIQAAIAAAPERARIKALYDRASATAYIIASETFAHEAPAMLLHEIGAHAYLPRNLGEHDHARLLDAVRDAVAFRRDTAGLGDRKRKLHTPCRRRGSLRGGSNCPRWRGRDPFAKIEAASRSAARRRDRRSDSPDRC